MSPEPISPLRRAWLRWKALRLPWRKKFLIGLDLSGATFWEFADKLSADPTRMRRIVQYPRQRNVHYSDVTSQISPAWHQWLRHTRLDPPSLTEQSQDLLRQERLKVLVAQADARWAAKPRVLDMPQGMGDAVPASRSRDSDGYKLQESLDGKAGEALPRSGGEGSEKEELGRNMQSPGGKRDSFTRGQQASQITKGKKEDPWKKARGGPSEEWQPQGWDPNALAARR